MLEAHTEYSERALREILIVIPVITASVDRSFKNIYEQDNQQGSK